MREQFKKLRANKDYVIFSGSGFFVFEGKELPTLESLEKPMPEAQITSLIRQHTSLMLNTRSCLR